jgi:predicted metalloprotease with PDZ domain
LDGPNGVVSWYGEGMAEFYNPVITWRAGLITTEEYLEGVNGHARGYYGSGVRNLPASEIAARFWTDTRVRSLPYNRGALYLAKVNAQIRAKSEGKRSLDDIALAMVARKRAGQSYDTEAWLQLLTAELGPEAKAEFDDMLAGKLIVLPSDAFGPCFRREEATYPQFELGFDPASLTSSPRVVKGLAAGSAAARAGLRDGDEIATAVVLDRFQSDPDADLTLHVRRGGEALDVTYRPLGESAPGWRWIRVPGVPDQACSI